MSFDLDNIISSMPFQCLMTTVVTGRSIVLLDVFSDKETYKIASVWS